MTGDKDASNKAFLYGLAGGFLAGSLGGNLNDLLNGAKDLIAGIPVEDAMAVADIAVEAGELLASSSKVLIQSSEFEKVDLGNKDHKELINNVSKAIYYAFKNNITDPNDLFDFSNAAANFTLVSDWLSTWSTTLRFVSNGKLIKIEMAIIQQPPGFGLEISKRSPFNIRRELGGQYYGTMDGKPILYPFRYGVFDQGVRPLISLHFHRDIGPEFSNFLSYQSTGLPKFLFK